MTESLLLLNQLIDNKFRNTKLYVSDAFTCAEPGGLFEDR
jgi:hypothetical protein